MPMRAEEMNLQWVMDGPAPQAMQAWRSQPPAALSGFKVSDESVQSITYERRWYDWPAKILFWTTFGVAYLMRNIVGMESIYDLTVRFDPEGDYKTKVTIIGKADDDTRAALGRLAAESGTVLNAAGVDAG